ncbi:hypothetical protein D9M70_397920 [compost metagenome]
MRRQDSTGLGIGSPLASSTMRKTCSSGNPLALPMVQPVSCSAIGFMKVTCMLASVQITASPIERSVICRRSFSSNSASVRRRCSVMSQLVPTSACAMPSAPRETVAMARTWRTAPPGRRMRYSVSNGAAPRMAWRISVLTRLTSSGCSMAIHCSACGVPCAGSVPCSACMRASQVMAALAKSHSQMPTPPASTASWMRRDSRSSSSCTSLRAWMSSTWAM